MTMSIRVGIADDHRIVRTALREMLRTTADLVLVAEAAHGRAVIDMVRNHRLDVLVLDVHMPCQSGLDIIGLLRAKAPGMGILALSGSPEDPYALQLIRLGASGYLNKQCDPAEILEAVRTIGRGRRYLSAGVSHLLARQLEAPACQAPHERLSDREFQVFLKLAQGDRSGQVGRELSLSPKTISAYRCKLMDKLGLESNSDLTRYALDHRLIQ